MTIKAIESVEQLCKTISEDLQIEKANKVLFSGLLLIEPQHTIVEKSIKKNLFVWIEATTNLTLYCPSYKQETEPGEHSIKIQNGLFWNFSVERHQQLKLWLKEHSKFQTSGMPELVLFDCARADGRPYIDLGRCLVLPIGMMETNQEPDPLCILFPNLFNLADEIAEKQVSQPTRRLSERLSVKAGGKAVLEELLNIKLEDNAIKNYTAAMQTTARIAIQVAKYSRVDLSDHGNSYLYLDTKKSEPPRISDLERTKVRKKLKKLSLLLEIFGGRKIDSITLLKILGEPSLKALLYLELIKPKAATVGEIRQFVYPEMVETSSLWSFDDEFFNRLWILEFVYELLNMKGEMPDAEFEIRKTGSALVQEIQSEPELWNSLSSSTGVSGRYASLKRSMDSRSVEVLEFLMKEKLSGNNGCSETTIREHIYQNIQEPDRKTAVHNAFKREFVYRLQRLEDLVGFIESVKQAQAECIYAITENGEEYLKWRTKQSG